MNASTAHRPLNPPAVFLAGLQAGMIGISGMLAWLGFSAMRQRRSFWTAENLMATVFHGDAAIRRGFGSTTLSGLALYLLIYSLLGALFALAARNRFTGLGTLLVGMLYSVGWYFLWFRTLGQSLDAPGLAAACRKQHRVRSFDLRSLDRPLPGIPARTCGSPRGTAKRRESRLELSGAGLRPAPSTRAPVRSSSSPGPVC